MRRVLGALVVLAAAFALLAWLAGDPGSGRAAGPGRAAEAEVPSSPGELDGPAAIPMRRVPEASPEASPVAAPPLPVVRRRPAIPPPPPGLLRGRVRAAAQPQPSYRVTLSELSADRAEVLAEQRTGTDVEGSFALIVPRGGDYRLEVGSERTAGPFPRPLELRLGPGAEVCLDDLLVGFGAGVLRGRAMGSDGGGLAGVQVSLSFDPGASAVQVRGAELDRTLTDAEGFFAFAGHEPGPVVVQLELPVTSGAGPLPRFASVPVRGAVELEPWRVEVDQAEYDRVIRFLHEQACSGD